MRSGYHSEAEENLRRREIVTHMAETFTSIRLLFNNYSELSHSNAVINFLWALSQINILDVNHPNELIAEQLIEYLIALRDNNDMLRLHEQLFLSLIIYPKYAIQVANDIASERITLEWITVYGLIVIALDTKNKLNAPMLDILNQYSDKVKHLKRAITLSLPQIMQLIDMFSHFEIFCAVITSFYRYNNLQGAGIIRFFSSDKKKLAIETLQKILNENKLTTLTALFEKTFCAPYLINHFLTFINILEKNRILNRNTINIAVQHSLTIFNIFLKLKTTLNCRGAQLKSSLELILQDDFTQHFEMLSAVLERITFWRFRQTHLVSHLFQALQSTQYWETTLNTWLSDINHFMCFGLKAKTTGRCIQHAEEIKTLCCAGITLGTFLSLSREKQDLLLEYAYFIRTRALTDPYAIEELMRLSEPLGLQLQLERWVFQYVRHRIPDLLRAVITLLFTIPSLPVDSAHQYRLSQSSSVTYFRRRTLISPTDPVVRKLNFD